MKKNKLISAYALILLVPISLWSVTLNAQRKNKTTTTELGKEIKILRKNVEKLRAERDDLKQRNEKNGKDLEIALKKTTTPIVNGWVYDPRYGWLYTNKTVYPNTYSDQTKSWYHYKEGSNPRLFYSYKEKAWQRWDPIPAKGKDSKRRKKAPVPKKPDPIDPPFDSSVDSAKELMITHLGVIEDPVRTDPRKGNKAVWTFKHLMTQMAGKNDPSEFTLQWLKLWEVDQTSNGRTSPARPAITDAVITPWLNASGGERLNLDLAPFKLLAIANRIDLRVHDANSVKTAGEGRFVFGVLKPDGTPLPPLGGPATGGFTVILEYELMASTMKQLNEWALSWHELKRHELGSPSYNKALEGITSRFTDHGNAPGKPNGNAINQIRTNEFSVGPNWELREFVIDGEMGMIIQNTVALTPDSLALNGTEQLSELINENESALLDDSFEFPQHLLAAGSTAGPFVRENFEDFDERTFTKLILGGPFVDIPWSAAGIENNEARHRFALNTCHGCHRSETNTGFLQIGFPADHDLPESLKEEAQLAAFLTGGEAFDPVEPEQTVRSFNDLGRRAESLKELLEHLKGKDGQKPPRKTHRPRFVH